MTTNNGKQVVRKKNVRKGEVSSHLISSSGQRFLNNKQRNKRRTKKVKPLGSVDVLKTINNQPIQTRSVRYVSTSDGTSNFLIADLLNLFLFTTSASTSAYRIIDSIRIRHITITILPDNSAGAGTFVFGWNTDVGPHTEDTILYAQGMSFRKTYYPPDNSFAGMWLTENAFTTSESVFTTVVSGTNSQCVLDLAIEYILDDGGAFPFTLASAAAQTGISCPTQPSGTDDFVPVGLATCAI